MRLKYSKVFTILIITINIIFVFYTWKFFIVNPTSGQQSSTNTTISGGGQLKPKDRIQSANKHIKKTVTIVFRNFFFFDNDLKGSIDSILTLTPHIQILIVYDEEPYPPLEYLSNYTAKRSNIKFVNLSFDIRNTRKDLSITSHIKTKYVLLLPDSVRLNGRTIFQRMLRILCSSDVSVNVGNANKDKHLDEIDNIERMKIEKRMLILPFASNVKGLSNCCQIKLDLANWTLEYSVRNGTNNCDLYLQKHAVLMETNLLKEMPEAMASPFPEMFFIQAKVSKIKKVYMNHTLQDGKRLFTAFHNKQRKKEIRRQQFKEMYKKLQIKKVIRKTMGKVYLKKDKQKGKANRNELGNGNDKKHEINDRTTQSNNSLSLTTSIEYYGCEKNTKSCIGTVFNQKPFYTYLDKHTPPCCLEKLKSVFNHVLEEFETVGIRYWLDNQALRSAIDTSTLSPDAYEIDISFNAFDLERSAFLKKSQTRPLADVSGFYWIKATDGHYFRVQYSKMNQISVNLLPFDIDGERVVPSGFYGWKAKEFSSGFLHPMSTVQFIGKNVMCPNNVKEFLELKNLK